MLTSPASSGRMCQGPGTPLAKANHLWFSVYTEMARGALAEDLRLHSLHTSLKRSAVLPATVPQLKQISLKC